MKTFEDFARENDVLWNEVRARFGQPPLPPREYGIEAEFIVSRESDPDNPATITVEKLASCGSVADAPLLLKGRNV